MRTRTSRLVRHLPLVSARALARALVALGAASLLPAPGVMAQDSGSPVRAPGPPISAGTRMLSWGADLLQDKPPIDALNAYLDGFHFYSGRMTGQMEAHHYCSILNDAVIQCVIFDGNRRDAKLMGVEYIIGRELFERLPEAEKALWHSHVHEVTSGQLIAPGVPLPAETALMTRLVDTYGKTWHTWHTDQALALPMGVPQLMMGFTRDGQADPAMVADRDRRFGVDSRQRREARSSIRRPVVAQGADAWQQGEAFQLTDPTGHLHGGAPASPARPGVPPEASSHGGRR